MIRKEGKFPVNARVDVDYSKGKPEVKFSYTTNKVKKQAFAQHFYGFPQLIIFVIIFFSVPAIYDLLFIQEFDRPTSCNFTEIYSIINNTSILGFNLSCNNQFHEYYYNYGTLGMSLDESGYRENNNKIRRDGYIMEASVLLSFVGCYLLTKFLIRNKWYCKTFPERQANVRMKSYYKFKAEDVENNMVEIPNFKNVVLEYKATGDFNEYLERIKIREQKAHPYRLRGFGKNKKWVIKKLKREEYKWYARFFFSKPIKKGYLEVIYK